jgi:hypothetical protein
MLRNPQSKLNKNISDIAGSKNNSGKPRWLIEREQGTKSIGILNRIVSWFTGLFGNYYTKSPAPDIRSYKKVQNVPIGVSNRIKHNRRRLEIAHKSRMYNYLHA